MKKKVIFGIGISILYLILVGAALMTVIKCFPGPHSREWVQWIGLGIAFGIWFICMTIVDRFIDDEA